MKKILLFITFFLTMFCFKTEVFAGNFTVSSNYSSVFVGNKVTITVKVNNLAGRFKIVSSNGSVLSGGNSGIWLENETRTFQFTANSLGSATISVVPVDVADLSTNTAYTTTKTIKVNVISPSKNNYLSSLSVEGHTISPSFDKDTLEYSLDVENGTKNVVIKASKEDSTASIKGTGEVSLDEGLNTFSIVVTAQNGSIKTYKLNITVKELTPIEVNVNGATYNVIRKKEMLPNANMYFQETTIKINEEDVPAYYNETSNMTLIGLTNNLESKLFIYDNGKYTLYEEIAFNQLFIQILDMDESLLGEGYTATKINIGEESLAVYTKEGFSYPVLYGLNIATGEKNLYKYDAKENTLQILEDIVIENNEELYFIIIIGLFGFIVISYILFIFLLLRKNKKTKKQLDKIEEDLEKTKVLKELSQIKKEDSI